jgi:hypothetical protein
MEFNQQIFLRNPTSKSLKSHFLCKIFEGESKEKQYTCIQMNQRCGENFHYEYYFVVSFSAARLRQERVYQIYYYLFCISVWKVWIKKRNWKIYSIFFIKSNKSPFRHILKKMFHSTEQHLLGSPRIQLKVNKGRVNDYIVFVTFGFNQVWLNIEIHFNLRIKSRSIQWGDEAMNRLNRWDKFQNFYPWKWRIEKRSRTMRRTLRLCWNDSELWPNEHRIRRILISVIFNCFEWIWINFINNLAINLT